MIMNIYFIAALFFKIKNGGSNSIKKDNSLQHYCNSKFYFIRLVNNAMLFSLFRGFYMKLHTIVSLSFLCLLIISCANPNISRDISKNDQYKLVWADEFNIDGKPDSSNWNFEKGFVRNKEAQWYQADNAYCKDGLLIIEARRERKKNPSYMPESVHWQNKREFIEYTSSSLRTKGLHAWQFGRFEMRAKIDTRSGMWPAFWTLGINRPWPHNGEIDIMEYYNGYVLANVAWGDTAQWQAIWDAVKIPLDSLQMKDAEWTDKFHIWRMDWNEKSIKLYLDDVLLNSTDLSQTINRDGSGTNPFLQPHYILINLAVGGTMGGDPSSTEFPACYEIDYVRVYQRKL